MFVEALAVMAMATMSPAVTVVVVKSVAVVGFSDTVLPLVMETPEVEIELPEVGMAVPLATFHALNVIVPLVASVMRLYPLIVQAKGMT